MRETPNGFIELGRRLVEVGEFDEDDVETRVAWSLSLERLGLGSALKTWDEALSGARHVVVLGEAGAGKTWELRALVDRLRTRGTRAAFLPLEFILDSPELVDLPGQEPAEEIFFVIDALDESRLKSQRALELGLRRLSQRLGPIWSKIRIVVSCRVSDWRPRADADTLDRFLPATPAKAPANEAEAEPDDEDLDEGVDEGETESDADEDEIAHVRVASLVPLSDEQVGLLARAHGVAQTSGFLEGLARSGARELANRPEDVAELASYWREHGRIGRLSEVLEDNIRRKLKQRDERHETPLSVDDALRAAEDIAAALVLGKTSALLLPDDGHEPQQHVGALDPQEILSDWPKAKIRTLLSRPLFDEATLGRVRFHHRTVTELLAARWMHRLLSEGCPFRRVERLLVGSAFENEVVFPSKTPVLAWLANWDPRFARLVRRMAPEIVLQHGDPQTVPVEDRVQVLRAFVGKFQESSRVPRSLDWGALARFADEALVPTILDLFKQSAGKTDLQHELIHLARVGRLTGCLEFAFDLATNAAADRWIRLAAIDLVLSTGTPQHRTDLARLVREQPQTDRRVLLELWTELFPKHLAVPDILESALACPASTDRDRTVDIDHVLETVIIPRCPLNDLPGLVDGLISALGPLRAAEVPIVRHRFAEPVCIALRRLLRETAAGTLPMDLALRSLEAWRAILDEGLSSDSTSREIGEATLRHPELRRQFFWTRITQYDRLRWRMFEPLGIGVADLTWLLADLRQGDRPKRALAAEVAFLACGGDPARVGELRAAVADVPDVVARLDQLAAPPLPQPADKFEEAKAKRAKQREARTRAFAESLRNQRESLARGDLVDVLGHVVSHYRRGSPRDNLDWDRMSAELGADNVGVIREGLRRAWQNVEPPRTVECGNSIPTRATLGLAGLTCFFGDQGAVNELSPESARRAAEYSVWELQRFPEWLALLANRFPDVVRDVLVAEVRSDFRDPNHHGHLSKTLAAPGPVPDLVLPHVMTLLAEQEPANVYNVRTAIRALMGRPADWPELARITPDRARKSLGTDRHLFWVTAWLCVDASVATPFIEGHVTSCSPDGARDYVVNLAAFVRSGEAAIPSNAEFLAPAMLGRLAKLVCRHVRPEDDTRGAHTSAPRDDAERGRDWLVQLLRDQSTEGAYRALVSLRHSGDITAKWMLDWIDDSAVQVASRIAEGDPWPAGRVAEFARDYETTPRTRGDLFRILLDRLEDIRNRIENGDFSIRELFSKSADEAVIQRWLASELERDARGRYVIVREAEVDLAKRTDIRLVHASVDGPVTVEVKRADKWSFTELEQALSDQLIGQYMRPANSQHGVLFVANLQSGRRWEPSGGDLLEFRDLVSALDTTARQLPARLENVQGLRVVGLDLTQPRLTSPLVGGTKP